MLYNKLRVKKFSQFLGNEEVIESVEMSIGDTHTYLFHGPKGCGKTSLARVVAKAYKVKRMDRYEIDGASQTGVDHARKIKELAYATPLMGDKKVFIIDECHRLSSHAQDALLKVLEEPPSHTIFILCTTVVTKVVGTVRSRAALYPLNPLRSKDIYMLLRRAVKQERIKIKKDLLRQISKASEGIPRDAYSILQIVKGLPYNKAIKLIELGEEDVIVSEVCQILIARSKKKWVRMKPLLKDLTRENFDVEKFRRGCLTYLRKVMLDSQDPRFMLGMMELFLEPTYDTGANGLFYAIAGACWMGVE